jgi:dipeptidyl aminopeptidase/acylaminoacyl peptidase
VIETYPSGSIFPAVSPDGKRIVYSAMQPLWDLVEVSIANGSVRTLVGGGVAFSPDWAPSGKHFLFTTTNGDYGIVEDQQTDGEAFSRRLGEAGGREARWSPDGERFVFYNEHDGMLRLANASGSGWVSLDSTRNGILEGFSWSPDGQWISYLRSISGRTDLVKLRVTPGAAPVILTGADSSRTHTESSPAGEWIAYPAAGGIDLISPDGKSKRNLTSRKFAACGFAKDGSRLYGIFHNASRAGDQWQLWEVKVASRAEKLLGPIILPASVDTLAGFSLHPDGKRFLTSIARFPSRTWMLEGFEQPQPTGWWRRLQHW